jgi:hypothetical protein
VTTSAEPAAQPCLCFSRRFLPRRCRPLRGATVLDEPDRVNVVISRCSEHPKDHHARLDLEAIHLPRPQATTARDRPRGARAPALDASAGAMGSDGRRGARGALGGPRGNPRHDDRTDQPPEHQRKNSGHRSYEHYTGHALHRHLRPLTAPNESARNTI